MNPNLLADEALRIADRAHALADQLRIAGLQTSAAIEPVAQVVAPFVYLLAVFLMALLRRYYVVWNVTPALHSPLMAVTNAISSVIVVGAILAVGLSGNAWAMVFGFVAVMLASVNIFGGFMVTRRMLGMFQANRRRRASDRLSHVSDLPRRGGPVHPCAARPLAPVHFAAGQPVRHGRHGHCHSSPPCCNGACRAAASC